MYESFISLDETHESGDVIAVLVGDQDRIEVFRLLINRRKAFAEFTFAETRVDQNACLIGPDKYGIT